MASLSTGGKTFKLALIQLSVGANKTANLSRAAEKIEEAAKNGAQVHYIRIEHKIQTELAFMLIGGGVLIEIQGI